MIERIDHWLAKRVFHPPIIWLCQRTRLVQADICRYGWVVFASTSLWALIYYGYRWMAAGQVILIVLLLLIILHPVSLTNKALRDSLRLSLVLCFIWCCSITPYVHSLSYLLFISGYIAAIAGEYALTIKTIPPRATKSVSSPRKYHVA